jgi:hypothetical protein
VLLFDENLAARLVAELAALYPGCAHVGDRGLTSASDRVIWQYGRDHGLVIVTKDKDFQRFSILYGPPSGKVPKGTARPEEQAYGGKCRAAADDDPGDRCRRI